MTTEENLMSEEEREQVNFMWNLIPEQDRTGMTQSDILFVLDAMDDFLEEQGLLDVDDVTGEVTYLDGDIDETAELEFVKNAVHDAKMSLTDVQIQLIMDAEMQYGIEQGYYEDN
jgi:hypothetical protein